MNPTCGLVAPFFSNLRPFAGAGEHTLADLSHGQRLHCAHQISLRNFRLVGYLLIRPLRALIEFQQDAHLIGRYLWMENREIDNDMTDDKEMIMLICI